jgi:hypothetical protein
VSGHSFDRRTYFREWARRKRAKRLAAQRMSRRTCPRRFGRSGVCGAPLLVQTDGLGHLVISCSMCERMARGICRDCHLPVAGKVGFARRCAKHRDEAVRESLYRYARDNRELLRRKARNSYRKNRAVRQRRNDYKRLWRQANPEKIRAQKRRASLRQNARTYEYHRQYREQRREANRLRGRARYYGITEARPCVTTDCNSRVTGRQKKCATCKTASLREAQNKLALHRGRGKRTDLQRNAA